MRIRPLLVAAVASLALVLAPGGARAATDPTVDVLGVQATDDGRISLVADVNPLPVNPLTGASVQVTSAGTPLAAQVAPVLSDQTSLTVVVDASAQAADASTGGGLSGAASFLLQAPPDATVAVVEDRKPPVLVAKPAVGVADALTATSNLLTGGARATSDALSLAAGQARPGTQAVVVLYTSARDAGGEQAPDLAERLRAAHAVLAVVTTSRDLEYWSRVASSTGGLAISARPAKAIQAFDELADALRARYVVTFARPTRADAPVDVRVTTGEGSATAALALPADLAPASSPAPAPADGRGSAWWVWALLGALAVAAALAIWWWFRGTRAQPSGTSAAPDPAARPEPASGPEPEKPAGLPGVRVFDVGASGDPQEITGSLFEPRSVRDARDARKPPEPRDARGSARQVRRQD